MIATHPQAPSPSPRSREALERKTDALLWSGTKYAGDADGRPIEPAEVPVAEKTDGGDGSGPAGDAA